VEPVQYLRAIRRRWLAVVAAVAVALGIAWVVTAQPVVRTPTSTSYSATTVLIQVGTNTAQAAALSNLATAAALATLGEVPTLVAQRLHYSGNPQDLAADVTATGDDQTGLLTIAAEAPTAGRAAALSNAFADELIAYLQAQQDQMAKAERKVLKEELDRSQKALDRITSLIGQSTGTAQALLISEQNAAVAAAQQTAAQYQQTFAKAGLSGLQIVQPGVAQPVSESPASSTFSGPRSRTARLILAVAVGFLIGIALALVLERLDNRIRSREEAERYTGVPVLAEIPLFRKARRRQVVVSPGSPSGRHRGRGSSKRHLSADAFQLLRMGVVASATAGGNGSSEQQRGPSTVVLVTSPSGGEGKSTVAAHLAAAFSETGQRVLVLSCDFRRPSIHRLLGVHNDPGLSNALLSANGDRILRLQHIRATQMERVKVVPSGAAAENPAELLNSRSMHRLLAEARELADVVIVDTAAILTGSESAPIFQDADAVLVVVRAGSTRPETAQWTVELLKRLHAPVAGLVLNGTREVTLRSGPVAPGQVRPAVLAGT
jgi:capsular exopolysaccharide synthesis family protein